MAASRIPIAARSRDFIELAVAYGLILLVIWSPRPWQKMLWWVAAAAVLAIAAFSFEGLQAMGLRRENFFRSLWIVGLALLVSAVSVALAIWLHTLHIPPTPLLFIKTYVGYILWTFVQQLLMQCFFLARLLRLLPNPKLAAIVSRAHLRRGASAQPHSRAGHLALGLGRLPALSPLSQSLHLGHGARHPGSHARHHRSRAGDTITCASGWAISLYAHIAQTSGLSAAIATRSHPPRRG